MKQLFLWELETDYKTVNDLLPFCINIEIKKSRKKKHLETEVKQIETNTTIHAKMYNVIKIIFRQTQL